jgi:vacuolar-type H+-ATPase subunit I/STV1
MDESSVSIKERHKAQAVSKQQFAMTSMNNLALLLDDVLRQMQQQMADAMGKPKPGDKKGKDQPGMSELQQQLNDKIKSLKKGNKSGRQLSEELAKLAAEQEQLRKMLQEHQENINNDKGGGNAIDEIIKKMEETEVDIVNKNITSETIKRQEEILTRLLQSDEALREQEKDEKREAEQANNYNDFLPNSFEEYIKAKELEIELLKTVPPKLFPHYKNEVTDYFDRVNKKEKISLD